MGNTSKSTVGGKKRISPTNVRKFRSECQRRWAFGAIFGQDEPAGPALKIGTAAHSVAEDYYKKGVVPTSKVVHKVDVGRLIARAIALNLIPQPGPNVFSEVPVKLPSVDGFEMPGMADLVEQQQGCVVLYDFKTCAQPQYAKREKDLRKDEQVNIYGLAVMLKFNVSWIRCHWVYLPKDGSDPFTVEFTLTKKTAEVYWNKCKPVIKSMLAAYANKSKITSPEEFEGNADNCHAYNKPCPFLAQCEQWKRVSKQKEKDMGDFDNLLADLAATKKTTEAKTTEAKPVKEKNVETQPQTQPQDLAALHAALTGQGGQINAPEGAKPDPDPLPDPEVVDKPKKKRGRPKAKKEGPATVQTVVGLAPIRVYVGCLPVRGPDRTSYRSLVELAGEAMESACHEHGVDHWRLIDYKAEGALAAHFQQWLIDHNFEGAVVMDSFGPTTRALLEAFELMPEDRVSIVKALKG